VLIVPERVITEVRSQDMMRGRLRLGRFHPLQ
jgi:hypothetical protein